MKRKIILLLCLIFVMDIFAENSYLYVSFYKPYGKVPTYTEEYTFYDDGLIKEITYYDLREEADYYNWEKIKENLQIIEQYQVKREKNKIEVILKKNKEEKVVTVLINTNNNVWEIENSKQYNNSKYTMNFDDEKYSISSNAISVPGTKAYLADNILYRLIRDGTGFGNKKIVEEYKVNFDGNNIYRVATNFDYGEESSTVNYVSEYIPFTKEAALLNRCIVDSSILREVFYIIPTIPKSTVLYKDIYNKSKTISVDNTNKLLSINSQDPISRSNTSQFGFDYYLDGNKKTLVIKSENLVLFYDSEEAEPAFKGFSNGEKIIAIEKITSSSSLKEKKIEYSVDNLKILKLKNPWVEGVNGDGVGEYIQLNKKNAEGMYLLNGFISFERNDLYEKNNRIEKILIKGMKSKVEKEILLIDTAKPQYIDLKDFSDNEEIQIIIQSVYKGTKFDDTCLAGIILVSD